MMFFDECLRSPKLMACPFLGQESNDVAHGNIGPLWLDDVLNCHLTACTIQLCDVLYSARTAVQYA